MGGASQHAKSHAFMFTHAEDLHATIVAVFLILVWGIVYMTVINNRLYVYFNETVINSLLGIAMGIAVGSSGPLKSVTNFFLPWSNFANNILPFLIMYPASKLCSQSSRKKLRLSIAIAVLKTALCSLIISGSTVAYINTQSRVTFSGESNDRELNFHHIMYALHIGSSLSMYDTYLCVHNFPEFRDNTEIRGFLSSYGLASMSFALELSQMSVDLGHGPQPSLTTTITAVLKRVLFVPMVSAMLGVTAGLISSFVTKHSSFLHVQQEMVVLPCSNYISYTVAQKTGLSPVITSISCEMVQSSFCIHNLSEASKITYKSMLAKTSKVLGFFCTFSFGFFFGSSENRFMWKYVQLEMVFIFLGISLAARIFSTLFTFFCVKRLGFQVPRNMMFLQLLIHTRATPSLASLINLHQHFDNFRVCLPQLLCMQWSLYIMCSFVNIVNVPLVGLVYKRFGIEPDLVDGQAEPIFHVIFRLMYHEINRQIAYLSGHRTRCEYLTLLGDHVQVTFLRNVISLGFMSVPERRSHILSAYHQTISERSNVLDQRRKSVKSKDQIYATQVCARFIVRNLCFEGFHASDIAEYFFTGSSEQN